MTPPSLEWTTYLPDGRPLRVRRRESEWLVECSDSSATGPDLPSTLSEAVGVSLRGIGGGDRSLQEWVRRHAEQILAEHRAVS